MHILPLKNKKVNWVPLFPLIPATPILPNFIFLHFKRAKSLKKYWSFSSAIFFNQDLPRKFKKQCLHGLCDTRVLKNSELGTIRNVSAGKKMHIWVDQRSCLWNSCHMIQQSKWPKSSFSALNAVAQEENVFLHRKWCTLIKKLLWYFH